MQLTIFFLNFEYKHAVNSNRLSISFIKQTVIISLALNYSIKIWSQCLHFSNLEYKTSARFFGALGRLEGAWTSGGSPFNLPCPPTSLATH